MASILDILSGAGNLLDLPGSSLRDILAGRDPRDQWATPFSDGNRATGRDVLHNLFGLGENEETGMSGWMDNPMEGLKDMAGFGAEMFLDPMNLIPAGAVGRLLKGRRAARSSNAAMKAERGGKYAMVNPKVAGRPEVPTNPMLPEGIPELQPGFARAVHWASPENVDQIRESGLDYSRQGMLSSTAQVWGDGSKVNYSPPDDPRFSGGQAVIFDFPENELRLHDSIARSPGVLDPKYFVGAVPGPKPQPKNWMDQVADLETQKEDLIFSAGAYQENMGAGAIFDEAFGVGYDTRKFLHNAGYLEEYDDLARQADSLRTQNPMKRIGYTPGGEDPMFPGKETMHHGGRDMSASATEQHPYGIFDLGRLKTGEGANIFSPGAYKADVEATSQRYKEIIDGKSPEPNPIKMAELQQKLDEVFAPNREYSPQELTGPLNDLYYQADEAASSAGHEMAGVRMSGKGLDGTYGYEVGIRRHATGPIEYFHPQDLNPELDHLGSYQPEFNTPDWLDHFGIDMEYVQPKGRLYKYDAPLGTKDRFMKWEGGFHEQPSTVQNVLEQNPTFQKFDQYASLQENTDAVRQELATLKKQYGIDPLIPVKEGDPAPLLDARQRLQQSLQREIAFKAEMTGTGGIHPYYFDQMVDRQWTGEDLAHVLMGSEPANATLADTAGLKAAGVPGMKNMAGSTRGQTYNYAIWDQDLLNQMRVREIDGQRVPINPTTMSEQVERRLPQAADNPLMSTMNPMALQAGPGIAAPAVAGAVYNALQATNRYGGIQ